MVTSTIIGSNTKRFVALLPQDIARGPVITMTRIVGHINIATQVGISTDFASDLAIALNPMVISLQLLPVVAGVTSSANLLSPFNTSDIESSRIMWWRSYHPWFGAGSNTVQVSGVPMKQNHDFADSLIDVRTKRRFDRSRFSLVLSATMLTTEETRWGITFNLRGLVASTAGI